MLNAFNPFRFYYRKGVRKIIEYIKYGPWFETRNVQGYFIASYALEYFFS